MTVQKKILIAGVGGQGVVYLTNVLVEAALFAKLRVATSEIHGLAQRGGSVVAGITFGRNTYGFIEKGGADFLIGLEPLEAQRYIAYLSKNSKAVIDNNRILPYAVNSENAAYPDVFSFTGYLKNKISEVIFISEITNHIDPVLRNIFVLGVASLLQGFPIQPEFIEKSINSISKKGYKEKSLKAFRSGMEFKKNVPVEIN